MIVVDASATLAWLFKEDDPTDWLQEHLTTDRLIVPALWRLEVVNAILKKERQSLISEKQGTEFVQMLDGLGVEAIEPPADRTLEALTLFARPHQLTSYDAVYLELALDCKAPLLTLDNNLREAADRVGVSILVK
ncbi:MAG: type II toxin-antitoxin system VapC family toxin [Pirellulales bacterium]|nr:type II toxin-antitoxin system VapC family toxin [Pirellulales bacterium]